jgi:hypothetical protein
MKKAILGVCALASLAVLPSEVSARTEPGQAGSPLHADTDYNCFRSTFGIQNMCTDPKYWQMPIAWDSATPGNKTIILSANLSTPGALSCYYEGWTPAGVGTVATIFPAFQIGYSQVVLTVTYVPPGSFGLVYCSVGAVASATIVGMDYFAP